MAVAVGSVSAGFRRANSPPLYSRSSTRRGLRQQGERPAAVVKGLRGFLRARLLAVKPLRLHGIDGNHGPASPAFRRRASADIIRKVAFQLMNKEGSQSPPLPGGRRECLPPDEPGKESLHQILRVLRPVSPPPGVGIKRIPVSAAQFFQRRPRDRRISASNLRDERPARGLKVP